MQRVTLYGRKPVEIQKNSGEGYTYMSYAGPIFPMTSFDGNQDVKVEREITFDFKPYESVLKSYQIDGEATEGYESYDTAIMACDAYILKNDTKNEKTMKLLYPFVASLSSKIALKPEIRLDEALIDTRIHVGPYTGAFAPVDGGEARDENLNLSDLHSWAEYQRIMENGYQKKAFEALPQINQSVIVYELNNRYAESSDEAVAPTLNFEFQMDFEQTKILTYGFNGCSMNNETGECARSTGIPQESQLDYGKSVYLIVIGEDIKEYKLEAYTNGGCEEKLKNAGGTVTRYETTWENMIDTIVDRQESMEDVFLEENAKQIAAHIPRDDLIELINDTLMKYGVLAENGMERYVDGRLEDILADTKIYQRVNYLEFEVKIPANATMKLEASMRKEASYDFFGESMNRDGYDMMTTLGSTLEFLKQTATIKNSEEIDIINQNFGFNLEKGITKVELEQQKEHFFMDIRKVQIQLCNRMLSPS